MDMKAKVRKWGSSLGIVIPKEIAEAKGVRAGDEVLAEVRKISNMREIFGSLRGWQRSTQRIKEEARKGWG
jgi:antitoxin component of MazEF toxin-antitoxin module